MSLHYGIKQLLGGGGQMPLFPPTGTPLYVVVINT